MGLDTYRIYSYHGSNIIDTQRNTLLPDKGRNKAYNTDLNMASTPDLYTTKCTKYRQSNLFNDILNLDFNPSRSKFSCKDYGTPNTLLKDTLPKG